jgi:hypothetical protein
LLLCASNLRVGLEDWGTLEPFILLNIANRPGVIGVLPMNGVPVRYGGLNYSAFLAPCGSWVIGADMQCKLFVALQLKVPHHFTERIASERARGLEDPAAYGATPTRRTLLLNPYQLPTCGFSSSPGPLAV